MSFAWPWFALLLPLYLVVIRLFRSKTDNSGALEHPYLYQLANPSMAATPYSRSDYLLRLFIWCCLILALMRPQWLGEPVAVEQQGRALYLSVDLSESMLEQDMRWNNRAISRYQAVQSVVGEFVGQRQGDFIGLVVFGSYADVQAPLTSDLEAVQQLLADLRPGMADSRTAIGDGLALAVKQLREADTEDRVVILLSDGENNSGQITPEQATQVAAQSQIRVYTIGFGADAGNSFLGQFGLRGNSIDEATLKAIAEQTGGRYFRAASTQALNGVFEKIDELEPGLDDQKTSRQVNELYWLVLMAAVAGNLLLIFRPRLKSRRAQR